MYDSIIRNGTIIDGTGNPRFSADIGIKDGNIAKIGQITDTANHEIDAEGKLVTPGWVDIHTHYDGQATWDPLLAPSSWHGVTTVVMGNCGVGFAPVKPADRDFLIELMEGVEDIPGAALSEGIDWQWESFPEYLDTLESIPRAIDVATQVPHGAIRAYVMGERCNTDYAPTEAEVKEMAALVREGVEAGALGFSSSKTLLHKDVHGEYMPGTFSGNDEMLALGLGMKGLNNSVFELVSDHLGDDKEWAWVTDFQKQTGLTVTLIATTAPAYENGKMYKLAEQARAEGREIRPQAAGRPTGVLHGLQSSFHAFVGHPTWRDELAQLDHETLLTRLAEPATKAKILSERSVINGGLMQNLPGLMGLVFPLGENPNYEPLPEDSIAGIAKERGMDVMEVMYDMLVANDGKELFYQPLGGYQGYSLDGQKKLLEHPNVLFGLSDGGAHCGVIADAGMPTFIMTHWGRDRTRGDKMSLEFIVKSLTSSTARAFGMFDRGLINEGMIADINIIDFDELRLHRPEAVFDLPAGGRRLVQRAEGYEITIKSGEVIFNNGQHSGALPGKLVRRSNAKGAATAS
ncbi:MAG: amidohydrolase family protein [Gammaproteobacteria bacterium]|jgi:N-acyl-D-amino-acid deacylase|nr:amidohydrolase family protein [Gammaproteobacteria bacterium]MDG1232868.1 amidohydrolase family protein [Pseudomonadales bacterium]MBT5155277.1 amidohydrolase family protein [Gammaproteobacteria bacterium]MBT5684083.1 amidohydrolase family protein [Gammaproteobacteria bacterium]MBT5725437.1 amidohydrolase family protein [Gammaproteobacteria bacterium]